jgi:hypothetical protein
MVGPLSLTRKYRHSNNIYPAVSPTQYTAPQSTTYKIIATSKMRLLNVLTFSLEVIPDPMSSGIPYATLSHTWGDREASFEDMKAFHQQRQDTSSARVGPDFDKILRACQMAQDHGHNVYLGGHLLH